MIFEQLKEFRQRLYEELGRAKDAIFELMDAVLVSLCISSFVSLSQSPVFRRGWSSVYAGLQDSRLNSNKVMKWVIEEVKCESQPILVGDCTMWQREEAPTLKERTYEYEGGQRARIGQGYSTIAWIPEESGSWALPLRHERITSFESAVSKAAFQLKQVVRGLKARALAIYDRGYGNAKFVKATAGIEVDLLLRLSSNRCVFGAPGAYRGRGAPRKHGHKFKLNDPSSWTQADEVLEVDEPEYGRVRLMRWSQFHFKQSPEREMEILRVEVIAPVGRKRKFQVLWLAWLGETMPEIQVLWKKYLRRFAIEHWYRFAKQRLYWTQPQLSSTQAGERWSLLMILMSWQLWWARQECLDAPLPWQSPQEKLAPGRVAQAFASILAVIGTPAKPPKVRGKSPGRAKGECPPPRPRYPIVKKRPSKQKKAKNIPRPPTPTVA